MASGPRSSTGEGPTGCDSSRRERKLAIKATRPAEARVEPTGKLKFEMLFLYLDFCYYSFS